MSLLKNSSSIRSDTGSASSAKVAKQGVLEKIPVPSLEDYIPLGCVSLVPKCSRDVNDSEDDWIEVRDALPEVLDEYRDIWNALLRLWRAAWIRILIPRCSHPERREVWRLYVLPADISRGSIDRNRPTLKKLLDQVLSVVDVSRTTWTSGRYMSTPIQYFDRWATPESSSLFYLFNTLPSPLTSPDLVKERWSRVAVRNLLNPTHQISGLATTLYPYQRRAAAEMLRREVAPQIQLDPRLEERTDPMTGQKYYYGAREEIFLRQPRFYDAVRGGILAETMGLGKTLICIAIILSTRGHFPTVPPQYADSRPRIRSSTGSLVDMAAATISRHSIPWKNFFNDLKETEGYEMDHCEKVISESPPQYEIPPVFVRVHRNSTVSKPPEIVRMCHTTIVVVPKNLMHQWRTEFSKHVQEGALKILVLEDRSMPLPPPEVLATYDIILFSRTRFESEHKGGDSNNEYYESPLTKLHWLRIIIDEGHSFSAANTHAAVVAERLVCAERRWVVSGTPAKDLMGVEVEMAAMMNTGDYEDTKAMRQQSLQQRKLFSMAQEESSGAVKGLGSLTSRFLKAQPWAASSSDQFEDPVRWDDYIYRHEGFGARTFTNFSVCLRRVLESLVIKTQPEDVERDIVLPPLTHTIVKLEPSFIDKLTANLFVLLFTTNAVTSERRDQDYLFHKQSQHHLHRLIGNLRQSAFFWTGLEEESVRSSLEVTWKYLSKKGTQCGPEDRKLLEDTADAADVALNSPLWKSLTQTSDMGIFVERFPPDHLGSWAFDNCVDPMVMSLSLAIKAQNYVNDRLSTNDATDGLETAGNQAKLEMMKLNDERRSSKPSAVTDRTGDKDNSNSPQDIDNSIRLPAAGASDMTSPQKKGEKSSPRAEKQKFKTALEEIPRAAKRRLFTADTSVELSSDSLLGRSKVTGTTSSKFSYLIDRVAELQAAEKILIFYEGNHIAYFLSEIFDLLNIKYLLYANTLSGERRGKYAVLFDTDPSHRVLIMDIKQAAHGLNLSSASRVFFVNPVFRPNIEAQAIKRAHRIGQLRPVVVETLVLKGTVEEAMHERATKMTNHEHLQAKAIEDDGAMARIIQEARILPISGEEMKGSGQIAPLKIPQQIFGRPGRARHLASKLETELFGDDFSQTTPKKSRPSKKSKASRDEEKQASDQQSDGPAAFDNTWDVFRAQPWSVSADVMASRPAMTVSSLFGGD